VTTRARFNLDRPDRRRPTPRWHRLAYINRALSERIERLARETDIPPGARILDYGCADMPYRDFFPRDADYVPADLPGNPAAAVEIRADGSLPLEDAGFDLVLSTQVLEHVDDPELYLAECARVLRPGGRLVLSTHGIMPFHPDPVDYWRWTCAGLDRVVRDAGLRVERFEGVMGLAATGIQLVQDSIAFALPGAVRRFVFPAIALAMQSLIALVDRLDRRRVDSLVFALVAVRP
jgi:SAM-dependent methyltransferase